MDTKVRAGLRFFLLAAPATQAIGKEESRGTELQNGGSGAPAGRSAEPRPLGGARALCGARLPEHRRALRRPVCRYGLLHDIGRYAGVSSEKHLIDGYRFCMVRGWEKAAQICISHAFMLQDIRTSIGTFDVSDDDYRFMARFVRDAVYDDYDRLVQLCDALALPTGFCLLEKRFVDVALRYGTPPPTVARWKKILESKALFEEKISGSIYELLPGVVENTFR